jgi:2'-hydroxyisoflavone reductase
MTNRREVISQLLGAGVIAADGVEFVTKSVGRPTPKTNPLRILILGGTGFIGPHFVRAAVERDHHVAVFNRGQTRADLPAEVERLIGDRDNDLRSIEKRSWDCVLDLATFGPRWVRSLGEALRGRIGHYTFISTGDVYKHRSSNPKGTDEKSDTFDYKVDIDPYTHSQPEIQAAAAQQFCGKDEGVEACLGDSIQYASLKVLCEKEAEKQFPRATLIIRPGYMVGPGDPQVRFTYWVARIEKGGEILAPGDPLQPVQFIDVRDVAEWVIRMAEKKETGIYNAIGPGRSMSMCEMLGGIRSLFGTAMKLTWVSIPWIAGQDIVDAEATEWECWRFSRDDDYKSDKAISKGLTYRPLVVTAKDTLQWYKDQPSASQLGIATRFKVTDLATIRFEPVIVPWPEVMRKEQEILARWRIHQNRL